MFLFWPFFYGKQLDNLSNGKEETNHEMEAEEEARTPADREKETTQTTS